MALNRLFVACLCSWLAACASPYAPPKEGPIATLRLGGLLGSKGNTAYSLKDSRESCAHVASLAHGLKAADASAVVVVRAGSPLVLEIVYAQLEPNLASCTTAFEFVPESGAMYFLRLDEAYFLSQRACVPLLQRQTGAKIPPAVSFRSACSQRK